MPLCYSGLVHGENVLDGECISGDCINGEGYMVFDNANYEGTFKNGHMNGSGTLQTIFGTYTGQIENDKMQGQGTFTSRYGGIDEGRFVNGKYTGKCEYGNCLNGKGILTWANGSKYEGELKDGMMHGTGILKTKHVSMHGDETYTGQFKNGEQNGKGTVVNFAYTYTGDWKDGQMNGNGILTYRRGNKDEGRFINGRFIGKCISGDCKAGKGILVWASEGWSEEGAKYIGEVKEGMMHGFGTYTVDDYKYTGSFENGLRHGKGISTSDSGNKYEGYWKNDLMHGYGVYTRYGDTYTGEFRRGKKSGKGSMVFKDGSKYAGQWRDDLMHGEGVYTYPDGKQDKGLFIWRNYTGKCESGDCENGTGTLTWANGKKYTGQFYDGEMSGKGTIINSDGSKYTGDFKSGKYDGNGTLTEKDGSLKTGKFYSGEYMGTCTKGNCDNGYGEFAFQDGASYTGEWKDGYMHGKGILTGNECKDAEKDDDEACYKSVYTGDFKQGKQEGYGVFIDRYGFKYEGEWKHYTRNGHGTMIYCGHHDDLGRYEGEWKNDKWHGKGVYYNYGDSIGKEGFWIDGEFVGE